MSKVADSIRRGLEEALAYAKGEADESVYGVHVPKRIGVKAIRTNLGMTQVEFAGRFGFSVNTLRHWEQCSRQPEGPTRACLLEHFQAKWTPVRVKKMRQYKDLEPRSDSIGTEMALACARVGRRAAGKPLRARLERVRVLCENCGLVSRPRLRGANAGFLEHRSRLRPALRQCAGRASGRAAVASSARRITGTGCPR